MRSIIASDALTVSDKLISFDEGSVNPIKAIDSEQHIVGKWEHCGVWILASASFMAADAGAVDLLMPT